MAPKVEHKRHSAKHKIDRRLGVNLWGRQKSPVNAAPYAPDQHGQRRKKPTDFGIQLMAKQKLKGYYGNIGEKQFKKYYIEASRRRGDTGQIWSVCWKAVWMRFYIAQAGPNGVCRAPDC